MQRGDLKFKDITQHMFERIVHLQNSYRFFSQITETQAQNKTKELDQMLPEKRGDVYSY